jgi:F-type H+-transporting ATPase subunit epsilon
MVVARSPEGEFAILRGHIPFLAALVPGRVSVVEGGGRHEFFVSGGFLEASGRPGSSDEYHVIVLADDAENVDDIDLSEARNRLAEAQRNRDQDGERAESRVRAAQSRLELAEGRGR